VFGVFLEGAVCMSGAVQDEAAGVRRENLRFHVNVARRDAGRGRKSEDFNAFRRVR